MACKAAISAKLGAGGEHLTAQQIGDVVDVRDFPKLLYARK